MHAVLEEIVDANPDLRILHREMPILQASSEHAARMSAIIWRERPDDYVRWHDAVMMSEGALSEEDVYRIAASVIGEEDSARYREMILSGTGIGGEAETAIADNLELADRIGARGTLFMLLDGPVLRGAVGSERLQAAIDAVRSEIGRAHV